ncbi:MAG: hypothetical protein J6O09_00675 [Lachnospiraceae bacterium]|nr:hypothetical protein [Lachnospiraceae bacterium]
MKIKVDTAKLNNQFDSFNRVQKRLNSISDKLMILSNKRDWDDIYDGIAESIKYDISSYTNAIELCSSKASTYCQFLQNAVNRYDTCERELNDVAMGRDTSSRAGYAYPEHNYIDEAGGLRVSGIASGLGEELTKGLIDEGAKQLVGKGIPVAAIYDGGKSAYDTFNQNSIEFENGDVDEGAFEAAFGLVYNAAKIIAPIAIAAAIIPAAAPVGVAILASAAIGVAFSLVVDSVEYVVEDTLMNKETGERQSAQEHFENLGSGFVKTCKKIFAPLSKNEELFKMKTAINYV